MTVSTKSKLILATVSGALLFATGTGIALADDQREGARSERGMGAAFRAGERFAMLDSDGDRALSLDEFLAGTSSRFETLDADGNGEVTSAEILAARDGAREARARRMIERFDADGNGSVSLDEMEARASERFARIDRNDDGSLEPRELRRGFRGGDRDERGGPRRGVDQPTQRDL